MKKFVFLVSIYLTLQYSIQHFVVSDDLIFDSLVNRLGYERAGDLLADGKDWRWISYALMPLIIVFKIFAVATCLTTGSFFLRSDIAFARFLVPALDCEFLFLIPGLGKLLWFTFFSSTFSLEDLQYFSPLSIFSLFDPVEVEAWLVYPLQVLNLFELAYLCALAWQLREVVGRDYLGSFAFVISTYGVGLLLWVVFVMFITVTLS